jgi:hypothetical protein
MKTAVVFDRDSTLAYTRHRWHLSPMADPKSSWAAYAAACLEDSPIRGAVAAARLHYPHHRVHICSGMDASAAYRNRLWLDRHFIPYDEIRLRREGDEITRNEDLKVDYLQELRARGIEPVLFYEDWGPAADAIWRLAQVPVVGVTAFYPEDAEKFRAANFDGAGGGL